jgi:hypothetical protein
MGQYVGTSSRGPFYSGGWTDSRNPASGARNPFIEMDPGNPFAQGVPSVGGGSRDPTGMNYQQKQNLGRQSHLDEAAYNAQMEFLNNRPEWFNVPVQNQPYYFQQMGVTNTANANRDATLGQANAQKDASIYGSQAGVQSTGITANAALEKAKAEAAALLGQTQLQTGAAERISSGRNDALLGALGGWTNMLGNTLPGMFGGLGNAIGGFGQATAGGGQNQQQAGFQDPYKKYRDQIAGREQGQPNNLLAALRGMA